MSFDQQSNCKKINRSILTFACISVVNPNMKRLIRNLDDLGNDELRKRVNNWLQMSVDETDAQEPYLGMIEDA